MPSSKLKIILCALSFFPTLARAEKNPPLPPPYATHSANRQSQTIGWPEGKTPVALEGYVVTELASLPSPRRMYRLPNGDILVSQGSAELADAPNQITRLHMSGSNLASMEVFASDLHLPYGMALWQDQLFVGEPDRVLKFKIKGDSLSGPGQVILNLPFPAPQHHWTRDLLLSPDGQKLYASVGSGSNVGEDNDPLEPQEAAILTMGLDGSNVQVLASGLRNPVSLAWEPKTHALWTVVNERDELGDQLVPDYITHVTEGAFYGWPYAYWGPNPDPRQAGKNPALVAKSVRPDYGVGAHTASLGISFTTGTKLEAPYNEGALIAQHGSWNSSKLVGYKVEFVPFVNGQAVDGERDFLTGFIANEAAGQVYGRPVSTIVLIDGSVLVSDDTGGKIWKVSKKLPENGNSYYRRPRTGDDAPAWNNLLP